MSQENVEVVRRMLIAFRNGDWAAAAEPLDPDIEMDTTRTPISGLDRVYNGLEEVAAFWREWLEASLVCSAQPHRLQRFYEAPLPGFEPGFPD
jgi:SnoaL-like domain